MTPTNEAGHGLPELPATFRDDFKGDDSRLIESAKALISLSDSGSLAPHGIGGHARTILSAFIVRTESALALSRGVPDGAGEPCPVAGTFACRCGKFTIPMDKGPWRVSDDGKDVFSDDFSADVALRISGDFIDDHHRKDYAAWLARTLNGAAAPAAAGAQGEEYQRGYAQGVADTQKSPKYDSTGDTVYTQPAAADGGVRERARALLAASYRECGDKAQALDVERRIPYVQHAIALRAIEAALSSHRQAGDVVTGWLNGEGSYLSSDKRARMIAAGKREGASIGEVTFGRIAEDHRTALYAFAPSIPGLVAAWRERINVDPEDPYEHGVSDTLMACADELMALVEKGAGNGR